MGDILIYFMFPAFVLWSAHCIGDYPLQGEFLAKYKSESFLVLFCHSTIYTATVMIGFYILYFTGSYIQHWTLTQFCLASYFILFTHIAIDAAKCHYRIYLQYNYPDLDNPTSIGHKYDVKGYYLDQLFHAIILALVLIFGTIHNS